MNSIYIAAINADKLPLLNFNSSLQNVIRVTMAVIAMLSVLFIVIGGLKYVLAAGDPQQITKAKDTILYALVGLALAISTFVILSFVLAGVG